DEAYRQYLEKKDEQTKVHVEDETGINREGVGLNSKQLEVLLDEYDRNRSLKQIDDIAKAARKNEFLRNRPLSEIIRFLEVKQHAEERALEELKNSGLPPEEILRQADSRSDLVTETYQRIEIISTERIVSKKAEELAEIVVTKEDPKAVEKWFKDEGIEAPVLEKTVERDLVEVATARREVWEKVIKTTTDKLAEVLADVYEIKEGQKTEELKREVEVRVKQVVLGGNLTLGVDDKYKTGKEGEDKGTGSSILDEAEKISGRSGALARPQLDPQISEANKGITQMLAKDAGVALKVATIRRKEEELKLIQGSQELEAEKNKKESGADLEELVKRVEPKTKREELLNEIGQSGDIKTTRSKIEEAIIATEIAELIEKVEPKSARDELDKIKSNLEGKQIDIKIIRQEVGLAVKLAEVKEAVEIMLGEKEELVRVIEIKSEDFLTGKSENAKLVKVVSREQIESGKVTLQKNQYYETDIIKERLAIQKVMRDTHCTQGEAERAVGQSVIIKNLINFAHKGGSVVELTKRINAIPTGLETGNIKLTMLKRIGGLLADNDFRIARSIEYIGKVINTQEMLGGLVARAGQTLGLGAVKEWGLSLAYKWGGETLGAMASHFAVSGTLEQGLTSLLGQLIKTGTVKAVATTATTAAVDATLVTVAGTGVGAPAALVAFAIQIAAGKLIKSLKTAFGKIGNALEQAGLIDQVAVKNFFGGAAKLGGAVIAGAGVIGGAIIGIIPALLSTLAFPVLIVVITLVAIPLYNHLQTATTQASPLVINKGALNSNCVKKTDVDGTPAPGEVNCNKNAPEVSFPGIDKAGFVSMANRWHAGANSAEDCYNDVVNRALCAGVNPAYALWAWVHESGASNYTISGVKDFGIYGQASVPAQDFNAQINYFLKLDPGAHCLGQPGIGNDYWLGFATNYLNGSCNPDEKNPTNGQTGREYLADMKNSWSFVSNSPMPENIKVSKGGSCSPGARVDGKKEVVGPDGGIYICDNSQDPVSEIISSNEQAAAGTTYDPNATGLAGEVIPGECSVASKVVLTKQCGQKWSSRVLAGGNCLDGSPGTICKAGCGPSSVSMMLRHGNSSLTPDNVIFRSGSAYSSMGCGGSSLSQAYTTLVGAFGGGAVKYDGSTSSCTAKDIGAWICAGKVVMVLADFYRNSQLGIGGHFVLAVAVQNGNIITADPYYSVATPFDGKKAAGHIAKVRGCLTVNASAIK
nr:hypothetical protein [Candidatus Shapirobacteria bacterium]